MRKKLTFLMLPLISGAILLLVIFASQKLAALRHPYVEPLPVVIGQAITAHAEFTNRLAELVVARERLDRDVAAGMARPEFQRWQSNRQDRLDSAK